MTDHLEHQLEENASLLQRLAPSPLTRRRVLLGGGIGALALVGVACGDDDDDEPASSGTSTTEGETGGDAGGDLAIAMTGASLELLAVNTYQAALDAVGSGQLEVPDAVAEFVTTVQAHHQAHLDALKGLLGPDAQVTPPAELEATVNQMFMDAGGDVVKVAELARTLERTAADTYFAVIPQLEDKANRGAVATIQPVEMQHVAILNYVLGEYPVPNVFANADNAFSG